MSTAATAAAAAENWSQTYDDNGEDVDIETDADIDRDTDIVATTVVNSMIPKIDDDNDNNNGDTNDNINGNGNSDNTTSASTSTSTSTSTSASSSTSASASASTVFTFRDCWLLFGDVDDLGWTHAHNQARKQIHHYMQKKYSNNSTTTTTTTIHFESVATPNTFFLSNDERNTLIVTEYIKEQHCDYIFSSSSGIFNGMDYEYALTYPNISWSRMISPPDISQHKPHNLIDFYTDWFHSSFMEGAVAAAAATTTTATNNNDTTNTTNCAGFINSYETSGSGPWAHVTGFVLGYHWMNPTATVHVVTMNSWGVSAPHAEVVAAEQLIQQMGCNVIAKHTDPNDVDRYVYGLRNNRNVTGRKIVSISRYIDMSYFVGDTVFTSQVTDYFQTIVPSIESSFLSKLQNHNSKNQNRNHTTTTGMHMNHNNKSGAMYAYNERTGELLDEQQSTTPIKALYYDLTLSPFTSYIDEKQANEVVTQATEYLTQNNPLCNLTYYNTSSSSSSSSLASNGTGTGTPIYSTRQEQEECRTRTSQNIVTPWPVTSYADLGPNTIYYDIPFQDGSTMCGEGTYYDYDNQLTLSCLPCPINTYRNLNDDDDNNEATTTCAVMIESSCLPCPEGTIAPNEGSIMCTMIVEEQTNQLSTGIRYYGVGISLFIVLLSVGSAVFVCVYQTHKVVRSSQPLFLQLLCLGTFLMGLSIIPLAIDDAIASPQVCDRACMAFPWLFILGFSSAFAALFSKIWRLNQIFSAALRMKRITVDTKDVMIPFVGLLSMNIILLLCWTILDPPRYERISVDSSSSSLSKSSNNNDNNNPSNESFGSCWNHWSTLSISVVIVLVVLNTSAVVLANIQSYRARYISDEFSETKYIGLIMGSFLQCIVTGVPLIFLVHNQPTAFFFVLSSIVLITSTSLLFMMFVPKFNYILKQRRRDSNNNARNRRGSGSGSGSGSESYEQQQHRRRSSSMMSGRYSSSLNLGGGDFDRRHTQHLDLDCTHSDEIRISAVGTEAAAGLRIINDKDTLTLRKEFELCKRKLKRTQKELEHCKQELAEKEGSQKSNNNNNNKGMFSQLRRRSRHKSRSVVDDDDDDNDSVCEDDVEVDGTVEVKGDTEEDATVVGGNGQQQHQLVENNDVITTLVKLKECS